MKSKRPAGWSQQHIEFLRRLWKKLTPQHSCYMLNEKLSDKILEDRPMPELLFIIDCKIPHLSKWAHEEARARLKAGVDY